MQTEIVTISAADTDVEAPTVRGLMERSKWMHRLLTFLMVLGPGLIVMVADNDAGAVSTYVQAGAQYGTRLLWVLLLLWPTTYFIQAMVIRLGIATGKGHAAMIYQRFGKWWGVFSLVDLELVNFLTLVTEFAAIALAVEHLGIAVPGSAHRRRRAHHHGGHRKLPALGTHGGAAVRARSGVA